MLVSLSLIDRLSRVMDPEELSQLGVLVDWAEDRGYYPEDLIAPVVGDDARWVYVAYLSLSDVRASQAGVAGLTLDVAMLLGWCQSRDLLCHVITFGCEAASRAATAVMMLRDGADPMDVWEVE